MHQDMQHIARRSMTACHNLRHSLVPFQMPRGLQQWSSGRRSGIHIQNARMIGMGPMRGETIVYGIMGANLATFAAWQVGCMQNFMHSHFCVSYTHLRMGYVHTLLTSSISQQTMPHLFTNMFTFYFFGTSLVNYLGPYRVWCFVLFGA